MKARVVVAGALGAAITLAAPASAQVQPAAPDTLAVGDWTFAPSLELRVRGEYRRDPPDVGGTDLAGTGGPAVPNLVVLAERVRLGLRVERSQLRLQLTLQDARAWGSGRPDAAFPRTGVGGGFFAPYEAYAQAQTTGARPSFVRLGRQSITWGEGMLLGASDWSPTGTAVDGLRGQWTFGSGELDAFAALLAAPAPLGASFQDRLGAPTFGLQLYGLRASWAFLPALRVEASGLARIADLPGGSPDGSTFGAARTGGEIFTGSLRVFGTLAGFEYGLEGIAQGGRARSLGKDRRAFGGTARVAYTLDRVVGSPELRATFSYATGDEGGATYGQLDPLLPEVHDRFGAMDLFAFSNVLAPTGRATFTVSPTVTVSAQYGYFRLAHAGGEWLNAYLQAVAAGTDAGAASASTSAGLGHEVDVWASYQPLSPLTLQAGYGLLALEKGARAMLAARGRGPLEGGAVVAPDLSHFAYVQVKVSAP